MSTADALICPRCRNLATGSRCPQDGAFLVTLAAYEQAGNDGLLGTLVAERYAIVAQLGVGGMGAVYQAVDQRDGRAVAIKFLRRRYAQHPALRSRFIREAEAAASVDSPYIVPLYDFGIEADGTLWMTMECVRGWTLRDEVNRRGALEVTVAVRLARQLLLGLEAIHAAGLVHRDLKHDNVMFVGERSRFKARLLDFGVVKSAVAHLAATEAAESSQGGGLGSGLSGGHGRGVGLVTAPELPALVTAAGVLVGSPSYMAPEQIRGLAVGPPADLYALGVVLYEALAARRLFTAGDYEALLAPDARRDAAPLRVTGRGEPVPEALWRLIERALAHDPTDRFPDARTMLLALDQLGQTPEPLPADLLADGPSEAGLLSRSTPAPEPVLEIAAAPEPEPRLNLEPQRDSEPGPEAGPEPGPRHETRPRPEAGSELSTGAAPSAGAPPSHHAEPQAPTAQPRSTQARRAPEHPSRKAPAGESTPQRHPGEPEAPTPTKPGRSILGPLAFAAAVVVGGVLTRATLSLLGG